MRSALALLRRLKLCGNGRAAVALAVALSAIVPVGCSNTGVSSAPPDAEHDADDVPITEKDVDMPRDYTTAVERIDGYAQQIFRAIEAGQPSKAHRPLDEMDIVIGRLMFIARDSGVARADWEEVNVARREFRAQFDAVHESIDHNETPDIAAARPAIVATLGRLKAVAAKQPAPPFGAEPESRASAAREEAAP